MKPLVGGCLFRPLVTGFHHLSSFRHFVRQMELVGGMWSAEKSVFNQLSGLKSVLVDSQRSDLRLQS